jgi:hypothetical protein
MSISAGDLMLVSSKSLKWRGRNARIDAALTWDLERSCSGSVNLGLTICAHFLEEIKHG